jgi:hypothetical protein
MAWRSLDVSGFGQWSPEESLCARSISLVALALWRIKDCFCLMSVWFSLPLAIWLGSGWVGLLLHWQAFPSFSWMIEKGICKPNPLYPGKPAGTEPLEGVAG